MKQHDILDGWKAIAHYLGKSVKTVQRWEMGAQLPVYRPEGKQSVYALPEELDDWVRNNSPQNGNGKTNIPASNSTSAKRYFILVVVVVLVVSVALYSRNNLTSSHPMGNLSYVGEDSGNEGSALKILNSKGETVLFFSWPEPHAGITIKNQYPRFFDFADLNRDGLKDLVIADPAKPGIIDFYQQEVAHTLSLVKSIDVTGRITFHNKEYTIDKIQTVESADLNGDGRDDFVIIGWDRNHSHTLVSVLDSSFEPILSLQHPGRLNSSYVIDSNQDSRRELIITGTNNAITEFSEPIILSIESSWQIKNRQLDLMRMNEHVQPIIPPELTLTYVRLNCNLKTPEVEKPWQAAYLNLLPRGAEKVDPQIHVVCDLVKTSQRTWGKQEMPFMKEWIRIFDFAHGLVLNQAGWRRDLLFLSGIQLEDALQKELLIPHYWNGTGWQTEHCQVPHENQSPGLSQGHKIGLDAF